MIPQVKTCGRPMKMDEKILQMENYLASIILGEFPGLDPGGEEPRHMGVRYRMTFDYDKETEEMKLDLAPVLSEESPEWLGPVLNMCLTQVSFALEDDPVAFLKYFQREIDTGVPQRMGDIYLNIPLYDKMFMYHLPLGCALHLLPKEVLQTLKRVRGHLFCREVIKELSAREQHTR